MNILIFGKDGQLGLAFKSIFVPKKMDDLHRIHYLGHSDCDLTSPTAILRILNLCNPKLIINTAAYTAVDQAQTEDDLAFSINAKAPAVMACYARENGATFLHYSTDYVFDGTKKGPYEETDVRNPLSVYGRSKAAGEEAIEAIFNANQNIDQSSETRAQFAILRTSWLYGQGTNFIRTILRLAKERTTLKIISDQSGVPTSAAWLATISTALILNDKQQLKAFPSGIYHAVPHGETTWYNLACYVVQVAIDAGAELSLSPHGIEPIPTTDYPLPAPRPKNSRMKRLALEACLDNMTKLQLLHQPWEQQVATYVQDLILHERI